MRRAWVEVSKSVGSRCERVALAIATSAISAAARLSMIALMSFCGVRSWLLGLPYRGVIEALSRLWTRTPLSTNSIDVPDILFNPFDTSSSIPTSREQPLGQLGSAQALRAYLYMPIAQDSINQPSRH